MNSYLVRGTAIAFLFAILASNPAQAAEELKIAAAYSPMANIFSKIKDPFEKEAGIKLVFLGADPKGMAADAALKFVNENAAEVGSAGSGWEPLMSLAKEKGMKLNDPESFKFRVIGFDRIRFITDKSGPSELPFAKLKLLFTGKVKNWKEIGGADQPVTIVLMKQPAALKLIEDKVLEGQKVRRDDGVKEAADAEEMNKIISSTPGSIGFGPLAWTGPDLKFPTHEELGRPLILFFRAAKEPPAKIQKLLEFIKNRGPALGIPK